METSVSTRSRVIRLLLVSPLDRICADRVAARLRMSTSTLRRRLRAEKTSYQQLLDAVRQHRCERVLARRWLPGKSIAQDLGFREPNSFYRAFNKWTGKTYTQYKKEHRISSVVGG
jgi:AraC family mar-sox-rob regulon transcriptional activator